MKKFLEILREHFFHTPGGNEKTVFFPEPWTPLYTEEWIETMNAAAGEIVRQYCDEHRVVCGPTIDCITLGDAPLDVLPFIPLACREICEYGTYSVFRFGEHIGNVTYSGRPEQNMPGIAFLGVVTEFTAVAVEKAGKVEFKIVFRKEEAE